MPAHFRPVQDVLNPVDVGVPAIHAEMPGHLDDGGARVRPLIPHHFVFKSPVLCVHQAAPLIVPLGSFAFRAAQLTLCPIQIPLEDDANEFTGFTVFVVCKILQIPL